MSGHEVDTIDGPFNGGAMTGMQHGYTHSQKIGRWLSEQDDFDMGSRMAQILSGCMFFALAVYLVFSNSPRLKHIQVMSYEKRLNAACQINSLVAGISAFLNFFQLTEVDNIVLPAGRKDFSVDMARPIEWILTCPMLQLSLVLMGGPAIPEYRRALMPFLAATVLIFGAMTLFVPEPANYALFAIGLCFHICAMTFNRMQILEVTNGKEGLLTGDSEFRKATLVLMATWCPFPLWYIITPEGLGLVTNLVVVQMGWAVLNIVSKFTMIFFIQRIKDNYWQRVKLSHELKLAAMGVDLDSAEGQELDPEMAAAKFEQIVARGNQAMMDAKSGKLSELENLPGFPSVIVPVAPMLNIPEPQKGSATPTNGMQQASNVQILKGAIGPGDFENFGGSTTLDYEPFERKLDNLEFRLMEKMDMMLQGVATKMEKTHQDIAKVVEVSQELVKDKIGSGLLDTGKAVEKAVSTLEIKMELAHTTQREIQAQQAKYVQSQLESFPDQLIQRVAATYDANTNAIQVLQESMDDARQKLATLQESQQSVMEALGGSLSQMTDGWAQQIIQESKAAAFTLQTKLGVMEEMQNKQQFKFEEAIAGKLQLLVNASAESLRDNVVQATLASTEKLHASIEASKTLTLNENSKLGSTLTQMIKDMQADNAKHVEAGIGVFGNSLRSQLDSMSQAQANQRMELDNNIATKMDGLLGRMSQQSQKQVDQMNIQIDSNLKECLGGSSKGQLGAIKELQGYMEDVTKAQLERHQDMSSMVTSVLEQACGAKVRAEENTQRIAMLHDQLGRDGGNDGASDIFEARHTTGTSPRPNTAGARGLARRGSQDGKNGQPPLGQGGQASSKYSQYGMQVLNS